MTPENYEDLSRWVEAHKLPPEEREKVYPLRFVGIDFADGESVAGEYIAVVGNVCHNPEPRDFLLPDRMSVVPVTKPQKI